MSIFVYPNYSSNHTELMLQLTLRNGRLPSAWETGRKPGILKIRKVLCSEYARHTFVHIDLTY